MHYNVCFLAEKEDYKEKQKRLVTSFKKMDILPFIASGKKLQSLYLNSYFGFSSLIPKEDTLITELGNALCLYQNTGHYKADEKGILFNERIFNLPIKKDIWSKTKAKNFFIIAPTGGGKSFLANHIFRQLFEEAYILVVVDLGGSYEKLTALLESIAPDSTHYIRYEKGQSIGINPFALSGKSFPDTEKLNELTEFILRLWKRGEAVAENVRVSLRKLIAHFYQVKKDTEKKLDAAYTLESFFDFIAFNQQGIFTQTGIEPEFFNLKEFLHNTGEFVHGGAYGYLFKPSNRYKDIHNKRLVVFELEAAKDDPLLVSILMQAISQTVQQLIWRNKSEKGVVFFDEFAKILQFPGVLASVEYYYQAIRKQEAAVGVVLQSPNQLPLGSTAAAIIDNTPILYVLQNERGYKEITSRFGLDNHSHMLLDSMQNNFQQAPYYTEFFMQQGNRANVFRLQVPEALRLAYMTDGEENARLMALFKNTKDLSKAIQDFMGHSMGDSIRHSMGQQKNRPV